jgi:hypothetical protein
MHAAVQQRVPHATRGPPPGAQAALSLVLIPPLVAGVTWILLHTGPWLPFALWAFMFGVQLAALTVYPVLIAPLFNKFDALPPGPLRRALNMPAARMTAATFPHTARALRACSHDAACGCRSYRKSPP